VGFAALDNVEQQGPRQLVADRPQFVDRLLSFDEWDICSSVRM